MSKDIEYKQEGRHEVDAWARFLDTPFGRFLKERTDAVHNLARDERCMRVLATPPLAMLVFGLLLAVLFRSPWVFAVALPLVESVVIAEAGFWRPYRDSEQRERDRLDTDTHLMDRGTALRAISGASISKAADHALPETRAGLDASGHSKQRISPRSLGVRIGECHGVDAWLSLERPAYILAPARSGKTSRLMIPLIMEAPGPVLATSSRKDILDATFALRRDGFSMPGRTDSDGRHLTHPPSPVWVFDPTGIVADEPEYAPYRIHWNPLRGCEEPKRAQSVAAALVGSEELSAENATWSHIGVQIVQSLLLAAAISHVGLDTVYGWAQDMAGVNRAATILEQCDDEKTRDWAKPLRTLRDDDARTRSNKFLTVSTAFEPLSLPSVRSWFRPAPADEFDMRSFLTGTGTVYMLAPLRNTGGQAESSTGVFANMFLNELRDTARDLASHARYGKLEPYVVLALDEVANIAPWEGLPQLDTAGTGDGIVPVKVFQSRDQARAAFGDGEERQMWDNSQKLVMGGQSTVNNLQEISAIVGEHDRTLKEHSWQGFPFPQAGLFGGMGTMERHDRQPVLSPDQIRMIPSDRALLISGSEQAACIGLQPWWERGYKERTEDWNM